MQTASMTATKIIGAIKIIAATRCTINLVRPLRLRTFPQAPLAFVCRIVILMVITGVIYQAFVILNVLRAGVTQRISISDKIFVRERIGEIRAKSGLSC